MPSSDSFIEVILETQCVTTPSLISRGKLAIGECDILLKIADLS